MNRVKTQTPPNEGSEVLTTSVQSVPFIKTQSSLKEYLDPCIHRIKTKISYGHLDNPEIDVALNSDNEVVPPGSAEHMIGVSYFLPSKEYADYVHPSNETFKTQGCILSGGEVPEGIDYKQDRALKRRDKRYKPQDMGLHYSVFPTRTMSVDDFERKLTEMTIKNVPCQIVGGCDQFKLSECQPTPDYPADALLRQVSAALFELATNKTIDPNRAVRALYFHYLLAEEDAVYKWILRGDALSYYSAQALELCKTCNNINIEEIRDEIRGDLAEVILYNPKYRSYPDDTEIQTTPNGT